MDSWDLWGPFQIQGCNSDLSIPLVSLPKQQITGEVRVAAHGAQPPTTRCFIEYGGTENHGGYGIIRRVRRRQPPLGNPPLCVKSPTDTHFSLCPEALTQWYASTALERAGIHGAIPKVYDIFQYAGETRFCMDYIEGKSAVEAVALMPEPDSIWYQILAQAALLLGWLEETIRLDHRDLKADNLWIRERPIDYTLKVGGKTWRLQCPFQVVLLDFGFACIGGADGKAVVSLSDGYLPALDPCPKEGRDLFHLVASLWSVAVVRQRVSPGFAKMIEELLSYKNAPFAAASKRATDLQWLYITESDPKFKYPPLSPCRLLEKLSGDWKGAGSLKEGND